jgi:hypothetical protein
VRIRRNDGRDQARPSGLHTHIDHIRFPEDDSSLSMPVMGITLMHTLLALSIISAVMTNELHRDFRKGEFDFNFDGPGAGRYISMKPGGVRIKLDSGHRVTMPVGFSDHPLYMATLSLPYHTRGSR